MKQLIIIGCVFSTFMMAQPPSTFDAAGNYKLTGVDVLYTWVAREEVPITISNNQGFPLSGMGVDVIPQGAPFTTYPMQLPLGALNAMTIHLYVNLYEDGSGYILPGSTYPDAETDPATCVTSTQVLPVNESFNWTSNGDMMELVGIVNPGVNAIGIPGISQYAGQALGGLGLSNSGTFEDFPMTPSHPTACDPSGTVCYPVAFGDLNGDGELTQGAEVWYPGDELAGLTGGYFKKGGMESSIFPGQDAPDFYLEWHGIDGGSSGLGWGEDEEVDEDLDGTWFDRLVGLPGITATYITPDCPVMPGMTLPIFGDVVDALHDMVEGGCIETVAEQFLPACAAYGVEIAINGICTNLGADAATCGYLAAQFAELSGNDCGTALAMATTAGEGNLCYTGADIAAGMCIASVDLAASAYLMNPDPQYATWSQFLTANAVQFGGCLAQGGDMATCGGLYGADDSDHDFNGVSGRLTMDFDGACVPIVEVREVCTEFKEVGGDTCGTGDMNTDGSLNVMDVVQLVSAVLSGGGSDEDSCNGDMNNDGSLNVMDVVQLVSTVLSGGGRVDAATSAEFNVIGNEVTMTADGVVGGIQMTLSHGNDFALMLTDGGQFSNYLTEGHTTTLIIVNPANDNLFTTSGEFIIESVIVSDVTGSSKLSSSVNMLKDYSISAAYPNPFNPTTQMSLKLNTSADVSVNVFNMNGQLVDVIASGKMSSGNYNFTWDAANVSSGVYFIQTEVGSEVHSQKIMLIK